MIINVKQNYAIFRLTKNKYSHEVQCELFENCKYGQFRLPAKIQEIFFLNSLTLLKVTLNDRQAENIQINFLGCP